MELRETGRLKRKAITTVDKTSSFPRPSTGTNSSCHSLLSILPSTHLHKKQGGEGANADGLSSPRLKHARLSSLIGGRQVPELTVVGKLHGHLCGAYRKENSGREETRND